MLSVIVFFMQQFHPVEFKWFLSWKAGAARLGRAEKTHLQCESFSHRPFEMQMEATGASDKYNLHANVARCGCLVNIYDHNIHVCEREERHRKQTSQQQNPCTGPVELGTRLLLGSASSQTNNLLFQPGGEVRAGRPKGQTVASCCCFAVHRGFHPHLQDASYSPVVAITTVMIAVCQSGFTSVGKQK